ncbi:MAG: hypothetical protein K2I89_05515 [Muribaculaceae bacterium]|nr:hypothetical protein [Muribaculaceae bacterium]
MENKQSAQSYQAASDFEKGCYWHFGLDSGRDSGPNNAMLQNFKGKPYRALVREAIQNSLDAVDDITSPVVVEISFASIKRNSYPNFFTLKEHIRACADYYNDNQKFVQKCNKSLSIFEGNAYADVPYIKIADYNTKGMHYDSVGTTSPFYAFVRSAGVSSKNDQGSGGSFGFGKAAYFQLSSISSILVSTLTKQQEYVFEGISSLSTHSYNGQKVSDVGYYDNNNGKPVTDKESIPSRFIRNEVGTTVYILGFPKEEKEDAIGEMISETLRSFWLAIYRDKLVVKISGEIISSKSLGQYMINYYPDQTDETRNRGLENPHPYFLAVSGVDNEECYRFQDNLSELGTCQLYLMKTNVSKDKIMYMRAPNMLVYSKRLGTSYGLHGVFICEDKKGDSLLRELENPAHDEWNPNNYRDGRDKKDRRGEEVLTTIAQYIKKCAASIFTDNENSVLSILGTEETLYIPENLIEDDSEETAKNKTELSNDAVMTTEVKEGPKISSNVEESKVGAVRIKQKGSGRIVESGESSENTILAGIGGHTLTKSNKKGGLPTAGNQVKNIAIDNEGGTHKICIPLSFRVAIKKMNGKIYHSLIVHSPRDIIEGELEILSGGEQNDEIEKIASTNNGQLNGNIITGVVLEEGKNIIDLLFSDNMRHAIKLNAYENQ